MNWVLMLVLLVLVCCAIYGYTKGFLRIVFSLVAWVIVLVFVSWATPHVSQWIQENTTIYKKIEAACEESVRRAAQGKMEEGAVEQYGEAGGTGAGSSGICDGADRFGGFRRSGHCACGDRSICRDRAEPGRIYRARNCVCDGADSLVDSGARDLGAAWNRIAYSDIKRCEPLYGNVSGADAGTSYCVDCVLHSCPLQCRERQGE